MYFMRNTYIAFVCSAHDLVSDRPRALALMLADVESGYMIIVLKGLHFDRKNTG